MVLAILQFELLIRGAESIKDKRRVVNSLKDRLHREHQASVAEVGLQDSMSASRLGLALVASDGRYAGQVLDRITAKLRALRDAELGDCFREILHDPHLSTSGSTAGDDEVADTPDHDADHALVTALLERGQGVLTPEPDA